MEYEIQVIIKIFMPLLIQLLGLTIFVLTDPYISKNNKRYLLYINLVSLTLIIQNYVLNRVEFAVLGRTVKILLSVYGYVCRPVLIMMFMMIANSESKHRYSWGLVLINSVIYIIGIFTEITFTYDENGLFLRGPLGYTCHVISLMLLIQLVYDTVKMQSHRKKIDVILPIACAMMILLGMILDTELYFENEYVVSFLTITIVSASVFYYIWLHLQFVQDYERAMLAEQRIQIMISQIQPHFLFNTLSTIQALVLIDPSKAFGTLEKFGTYLRQNIESLNQTSLIPFSRELEHTQVYAEIEKIRFPYLNVIYDIEDDGFLLPALTLQPMVENAIRHGVRARRNGQVTVRAEKTEGEHLLIIEDNGKGFDSNAVRPYDPDEPHIGIRNVRERIEKMCGGSVDIESQIGKGTKVIIRIPQ